MPAEHALLGLLAVEGGSGHGYDLARKFQRNEPLGEILRLEPGMLYHHLKKLERSGWVTVTVAPQGNRPPRQVYHLTDVGQEELDRWLTEPVGRTREIRLEFLVKLFFVRQLAPDRTDDLISEQRAMFARLSQRLEEQIGAASAHSDFHKDVLRLRLLETNAAIAWLDSLSEAPRVNPT
jgi:DNA-binding PadR family transcriptional regulator